MKNKIILEYELNKIIKLSIHTLKRLIFYFLSYLNKKNELIYIVYYKKHTIIIDLPMYFTGVVN